MSRVKSQNTTPEVAVRKAAHRLGYRFRLGRRDLPGRPDLTFPKHRAVVFVHGCFWHRHENCPKATTPKSREAFWREKFERNVARDQRALHELGELGWKVLVIWECEIRDGGRIGERLRKFIEGGAAKPGDTG